MEGDKLVKEKHDGSQLSIFRCELCGEFLPVGRTDKRYHESCRKAAWQKKKIAQKHVVKTLQAIDKVESMFTDRLLEDIGFEGLKAIFWHIQDICQEHDEQIQRRERKGVKS